MHYRVLSGVCFSNFGTGAIRTASVGGSGTLALDRVGGIGFPEALACVDRAGMLCFSEVETPFGYVPTVKLFPVTGADREIHPVIRVPMHGWRLPEPTLEQTLATFWLLHKLGVEQVVVDASVGGVLANPLDVVIPRDVHNHEPAKIAVARLANTLGRDPWVRMIEPFCPRLRAELAVSVGQVQDGVLGDLIQGGNYWTMPLGTFETAFEIEVIKRLGAGVVGQSSGQEAMAARVLGMCLAVMNPVVNYAEGLDGASWSGSDGMDAMYDAIGMPMARAIYATLQSIVSQPRTCDCASIAHAADLTGLNSTRSMT